MQTKAFALSIVILRSSMILLLTNFASVLVIEVPNEQTPAWMC